MARKIKVIKTSDPKEIEKEYAEFFETLEKEKKTRSISKPQYLFKDGIIVCIIEFEE